MRGFEICAAPASLQACVFLTFDVLPMKAASHW